MNKRISKHYYQKKDRRQEIEQLQTHLDDLITDRASMEIVYHSLKNAYVVYPEGAEWEEIDKEICRAYDELMAQVRQLDRQLKRLDRSMKLAAVSNPQP
jgi:uncharacterized protein YhaN